ncbi:MAG TPA: hypothetical protein VMP68_32640 [Candidatus Eisenbacteria bacterium]|nr:hypothetical protein [Candidatus Eisenbacteria bacterium]
MSTLFSSAAKAYRRGHGIDQASGMEHRRLVLWQKWAQKLPNNAFVGQQLAAETGHS